MLRKKFKFLCHLLKKIQKNMSKNYPVYNVLKTTTKSYRKSVDNYLKVL